MTTARLVFDLLEAWRKGRGLGANRQIRNWAESVEWFEGYADGSDAPKGVVACNWNVIGHYDPATKTHVTDSDVPRRMCELFEHYGVAIEWSDSVSSCSDCGKCIHTQPDSMSWRPQFHVGEGEILCADCLKDDPAEALEEGEGGLWSIGTVDPAEHGYTLAEDERPFRFMADIEREMKDKGVKRWLVTQVHYYECNLYVHDSEMHVFRPKKPVKMCSVSEESYQEATEAYLGWCPNCEEFTTEECEPDAENRECPDCGEKQVCGAEDALLKGWIQVEESS